MVERIKLELDSPLTYKWSTVSSYCSLGRRMLCLDELQDFVELDDEPEEITLLLSKRPLKESYYVACYGSDYLRVFLSDGTTTLVEVYMTLYDLVHGLMGGACYLAIEG